MSNRALERVAKIGGLAVFIGAIAVWRLRKAMRQWHHVYPLAETFISVPQLHVMVERLKDGQIRLAWSVDADQMQIRAGTNTHEFPLEVVTAKGVNEVIIADPFQGKRTYYQFIASKADTVIETAVSAERIINLQGAFNFRDLGGYPTADGKTVRWGRVFRSANLGGLTDADVEYIGSLGIKLVCDLRSVDEVEDRPDRLPSPAPEVLMLPIIDPSNPFVRLARIFSNWGQVDAILLKGYSQVVLEQNAHAFGQVFRHLADPDNLPAIIHCTAGKDRAGMSAALLLLAIGVPEEVVLQDYSLSNLFFEDFRQVMDRTISPIKRFGITVDDLRPLLTAAPAVMKGALDYIKNKHGSLEHYLATAGITADDIAHLKQNLLED